MALPMEVVYLNNFAAEFYYLKVQNLIFSRFRPPNEEENEG